MSEIGNALSNVKSQLSAAINISQLPEEAYKILSTPRRVLEVSVPLRRDNGDIEIYKGFRVQFLKGSAPSSTLQIDFPAFITAPAGEEYQGFTLLFWRGSLPANEVAVVAAIEAKRVFVIERNVGVGR